MIEVLRESAGLVASFDVGLCLLLGTLVGMLVGAIPGLTATMGDRKSVV